jgi:hypothetical protein
MKTVVNRTLMIAVSAALMLVSGSLQAQNIFFPVKQGTVQVFSHKNARGNIESHSRQTIKSVEGSGANMTITYSMEALDKSQKPLRDATEMTFKMTVRNNLIIFDINEMIPPQMMNSQEFKVEIKGDAIELPASIQPGQSLKDAAITMTMDMGVMKMTTEMKMTDGKCVAIEDVTVPAGSYKCHKITQTTSTTAMRNTTVIHSVTWYAPGVGVVKSETYDKSNKLINTMEMISIKN